jgi:hypothetical protein
MPTRTVVTKKCWPLLLARTTNVNLKKTKENQRATGTCVLVDNKLQQ